MRLYQAVLGHPFVYEHVRPLAVGGIDFSPVYRRLRTDDASVVVDIGCGTGDALRHLHTFSSYVGFDTDAVAVEYARRRFASRPNVRFESRRCTPEDVKTLAPTHVTLIGLLHHLPDGEAIDVLRMLGDSPRLVRAVTLDIVYLPGRFYNNLMARLDRGRFCREQDGYARLARESGLELVEQTVARSHPTRGLVMYCTQELVPRPARAGEEARGT